MKGTILFTAITLLTSFQLTFSQVVINKSDFPDYSSYTSSGNTSFQQNLTAPSFGENQAWDITDLQIDEEYTKEFLDATEDSYYTDATYYSPEIYTLNQFIISSFDYYTINDNGYSKIGRRVEEVVYPITQLTGGPNDILKIVGGNIPFVGQIDYVQFPLEFGKTWTQEYKINTNYELTVEAYGLSNTPGLFFQTVTNTRTVVGSGKLTMPNKDGGVMTIDALLIKVNNSYLDSVYLGGQPAPPQLIAAFQLEQGKASSDEYYSFYAPGFGESVASYDVEGELITYQSLSGTTTSVETNIANDLNIFPNPVKSGSSITILNSGNNISEIKVIDQTGKLVDSQSVSNSNNISFEISNSLSTGIYIIQASDAEGKIVNTNKIVVE